MCQVYSFEESNSHAATKKSKKAPMAQLDSFDDLIQGFPNAIVQTVFSRKSPAAFFASWLISVFGSVQ